MTIFEHPTPMTDPNLNETAPIPSPQTDSATENSPGAEEPKKKTILIGSQRNPDAYRPKPEIAVVNDVVSPAAPVEGAEPAAKTSEPLRTYEQIAANAPVVTPAAIEERLAQKQAERQPRPAPELRPNAEPSPRERTPSPERTGERISSAEREPSEKPSRSEKTGRGEKPNRGEKTPRTIPTFGPTRNIPIPNLREKSDDLEAELAEMFQDNPFDAMMADSAIEAVASQEIFEESTKVKCRVIALGKEAVFVELGARDQGTVPLKQFPENALPAVGDLFDGVVTKFNKDEGLYEVSLPLAAAEVGDWSSVSDGSVVEARIVGINKGGLECEVGKLRGFMPLGQMATFRVENPEAFIGERWKCLVTEVNPLRRNLVLSRRALMEQENEEKREKTLAELEVGQVREGLIRKLIDVGAFVDLGGVDGFIHVSQMSWGRINHPSEVLKEGDRVKVTVQKIDTDRNRISLSFKDESLDPWNTIASQFREGDAARGRVVSIMPFGAFVEILPGIEGLVHISEISWKRVNVVADALAVGDWVDLKILSLDTESRKMGLSIKQLNEDPKIAEIATANAQADTERAAAEAQAEADVEAVREKIRQNRPKGELKGGLTSRSEGDRFGLKW